MRIAPTRAAFIGVAFARLLCGAAAADETAGFTTSLFNGRDLTGWHVMRCEAAVENGSIVLLSGDGTVRTDQRYGDFVLELDWKPRTASGWDSGVFFRADLPGATGRPWPTRYQLNLEAGHEGEIRGMESTTRSVAVKPGEWNHFKLTVVGLTAELEINGEQAWMIEGLKARTGYIALQAEVNKGGQFEFRNITITELGHRPLFDGQSLTGWETTSDAACWDVADGAIHCSGEAGSWLRSVEQYGDFNLRFDYRLAPGGNSGVYVRVPRDGAHRGRELSAGPSGFEVQLLDDAADKYASLEPWQYGCSLYKIAPATQRVGRPAGEWNSVEIDCRKDRCRVTHNGVVVVDVDSSSATELDDREPKGHLGLQNHRSEIWFRNLRIGRPIQ